MESASKKRGAVPDAAADLQFFEPAPPTPATATKRARRAAAPPAVSPPAPPPRLGHALPFITVVDGKFTVQPAALEALARMPGPLAVIAVAG